VGALPQGDYYTLALCACRQSGSVAGLYPVLHWGSAFDAAITLLRQHVHRLISTTVHAGWYRWCVGSAQTRLTPNDILQDVRRAFARLRRGKALHNRHWVTVYGLLATLAPRVRATLITQYGRPGRGAGRHFTAAHVVAKSCELLRALGEIETAYYAPANATYTINGRRFAAGYQVSSIYRRLP
jgi:hypothetical protein